MVRKKTDAQRGMSDLVARQNIHGPGGNPEQIHRAKQRRDGCPNQYNDCSGCGLPFIVRKGSTRQRCEACRPRGTNTARPL
jgi:hypothetical protein